MPIRLTSISTILFLLLASARFLIADTAYFDILNQEIEGPNLGLSPAAVIWGDDAEFHFNSDGQIDVLLRHVFEGQPFGISRSAVNSLRNAETVLQQSNAALFQIRDVLLKAANNPNSELLARWQQQIDIQVELMRTMSRDTSYGGSISFSHAPGRYAFTNTPETMEVAGASSETQIGVYDFAVSTIELPANSTQEQVIDSVNKLAITTGVYADYGPSGVTRFYSDEFGSRANLTVVSNLPATERSTGPSH